MNREEIAKALPTIAPSPIQGGYFMSVMSNSDGWKKEMRMSILLNGLMNHNRPLGPLADESPPARKRCAICLQLEDAVTIESR